MTKEEAREILKNSDELKPQDIDGELWYYKLGGFHKEYTDGFGFAVYPYSDKDPVDPTYAYAYFVDKEDGRVSNASSSMFPDEIAAAEKNAEV